VADLSRHVQHRSPADVGTDIRGQFGTVIVVSRWGYPPVESPTQMTYLQAQNEARMTRPDRRLRRREKALRRAYARDTGSDAARYLVRLRLAATIEELRRRGYRVSPVAKPKAR
jgi:hypothetical protein